MRSSISHPILHYLEGIRSHNLTKLLCFLSLKTIRTRENTTNTSLTLCEKLNWPGIPFFGSKSATPTVG